MHFLHIDHVSIYKSEKKRKTIKVVNTFYRHCIGYDVAVIETSNT